jgi:hypothetical protein
VVEAFLLEGFISHQIKYKLNLKNKLKMKKLLMLLALVFTTSMFAQEYYWTTYSFNVDPEDEEIVTKLKDNDINSSHQIAFTGTLDAMGNQYAQGENLNWDLFLTKLSQYTEAFSSAGGNSLISIGEPGSHPIQNIVWFDVENEAKFGAAWKKYFEKFAPKDQRKTLGKFRLGRSPLGETHYGLTGVNDFKTAFNPGISNNGNKAAQAAWEVFMDEVEGIVKIVRTQTRVMIGKW